MRRKGFRCRAAGVLAAALLLGSAEGGVAQSAVQRPPASYWVYVGAESADLLHRIRFGPDGAEVEKTIPVGELAVETEGPHGLAISRDGERLVVTTGHGIPDGKLWLFETGSDTLLAPPTPLGYFPATVDLTPDGLWAFAVNFNLHGEMVPSSVSVVYLGDELVETAQTVTCTMPHGSRVAPDGARHYSACMMDDQVVELDTRSFRVARRFSVARGAEAPLPVESTAVSHGEGAAGPPGDEEHEAMAHGSRQSGGPGRAPSCSPTWAQPAADGDHVYVACNQSDEILELSVADWALTRRFGTGRGPYNLAVTPDGRLLVATLKPAAAVEFVDLERGRSLSVTPTSTTVAHGVVVSPDSRYAFVSVEGVGAEPGKVDVFDLRSFERVASVEVGQQASGIAFWKMEPAP